MKTRLTIVTDKKHARAIVGLLAEQNVDELHMEDVISADAEPGKKRTTKHRVKGQTTYSVLGEAFERGVTFTVQEAESVLVSKGYSPNTVSPTISKLGKNGYLEKLAPDTYKVRKSLKGVLHLD